MAASSDRTAGEKSGCSPRSSIALWAMPASSDGLAVSWLLIGPMTLQNPTLSRPFSPRYLPRIVRRRDLEPQPLDDLPRRAHLRRVRLGELARSEPQAVLEPDAHVAAHRGRHRSDRQLVAAGAEHAPAVLVAEQAVGRALHVRDVVGMRADAAQDAEHALDEQRRLHDAAIEEVRRRVQVPDVVALDLEARAVVRARGQDVLDVLERVPEDALVGRRRGTSRSQSCLNSLKRFSIGNRPKFIEPMLSDATSGLSCSAGCSRSSIVIVAAPPVVKLSTTFERRLMSGANSRKYFGSCVGLPVDRIARVQMHDRGARFGRADRGVGDLAAA